jgi:hypothetical protein
MSSPEVNKQATEDAKARVVDLILAVLHVQPGDGTRNGPHLHARQCPQEGSGGGQSSQGPEPGQD